jgi:hypothetical protein
MSWVKGKEEWTEVTCPNNELFKGTEHVVVKQLIY